ncbi:MAG: serine/threonine protein kinase [Planctomycetia bacterium]|nr:serine/threonine protein kinase [Planctomycetia bacterium]
MPRMPSITVDTPRAGGCPDHVTLRLFLDEQLAEAAHRRVVEHLADCPVCDAALASLSGSGAVADLAAVPPREPWAVGPHPDSFVARVAGEPPSHRPLPRGVPVIPGIADLEPVGRGGMGVVYRGRETASGTTVAVKVLWSVGGLSQAAHALARREAEVLSRMDDPGIVRIRKAGVCDGGPLEPGGVPYIVMEWIDGETLQSRIRSRALGVSAAARVIRDLARILARVHSLGIVHRDIKPANVFLLPSGTGVGADASGRLKLVDFGLARRDGPAGAFTLEGELAGTPGYMAPEQAARDNAAVVGPATDVFGLGATLFFLLTGRPPPRQRSGVDALAATPTWPAGARRLPVDLRTIVEKCLQPAPLKRYASAGELADDIERFLDGTPIRARRAGLIERVLNHARRHPAKASAAASAVAMLGFAVVGTWLHTTRLAASERVARDSARAARDSERIARDAERAANAARETARGVVARLTSDTIGRLIAQGAPLGGINADYLQDVRTVYRSWPLEPDPTASLLFRAEGLDRLGQLYGRIHRLTDARACFAEALEALAEHDRLAGAGRAADAKRLAVLLHDYEVVRDTLPLPELEALIRRLLAEPAAATAEAPQGRSFAAHARVGLGVILARQGRGAEARVTVAQGLDELDRLQAALPDDPDVRLARVKALFDAAEVAESAAAAKESLMLSVTVAEESGRVLPERRDEFTRSLLWSLATLADLELREGKPYATLEIAQRLQALAEEGMAAASADLFYRGEYIEAVIREAHALGMLGRPGDAGPRLVEAIDLAHQSMVAEPALAVHAKRLAKALQCRAAGLLAMGQRDAAVPEIRKIAAVLIPWKDSPGEGQFFVPLISGALVESARLLAVSGRHEEVIADLRTLVGIAPLDQRPQAALLLARAAVAAGHEGVARKALAIAMEDAAALPAVRELTARLDGTPRPEAVVTDGATGGGATGGGAAADPQPGSASRSASASRPGPADDASRDSQRE